MHVNENIDLFKDKIDFFSKNSAYNRIKLTYTGIILRFWRRPP